MGASLIPTSQETKALQGLCGLHRFFPKSCEGPQDDVRALWPKPRGDAPQWVPGPSLVRPLPHPSARVPDGTTGAGHGDGRYGPERPHTELHGEAWEGSRAGKRSGPSSVGRPRPLGSSLWVRLCGELGHRLQREASSSPLATESGKSTESRPEGAERPPRASEERRAREASPADCHVGDRLKAGLPAAKLFSFRLLAPTGPTPTGPCAPRPPAAPCRRARRHHEEILPGDQS